jgi:hypothetical protein
LPFTVAKGRIRVADQPHLSFAAKRNRATFEGFPDRIEKSVIREWLYQEFHGSCLHGLNRRGYISVVGDEYNRRFGTLDDDPLLQFKTAEVTRRNIHHKAVWNMWPGPIEELLSEGECLWLPPFAANCLLHGFTRGDVIIDNEHDGETR